MVGRDAIDERVRAAGVFAHVAPNGAGFLAGGVRHIVKAVGRYGVAQVQVDDTRLHDGAQVGIVNLQDAVHALEGNDNAAFQGHSPSGKTGARATCHKGDAALVRQLDDGADFGGAGGKDHDIRPGAVNGGIVLI